MEGKSEQRIFDDIRSHFCEGKIQLSTEYPIYEPGNTVKGKVYLDLTHEIQAANI